MKKIPLTKNRFALVDDADYASLARFKWAASGPRLARRMFYAVRENGRVYMHREIMKPERGMIIDHINGDGLDNRRSNLRICTTEQNTQNCFLRSSNTSGINGVSYCRRTRRWQAYIGVRYGRIWLGRFATKELAGVARKKAERKYYTFTR